MKKRVALCFSGQFRNVEKTYKENIWPNLIEPNLTDFEFYTFCHSWFDKQNIGQTFVAASGQQASPAVQSNILETVYELYNPKKSLLEKNIEFNEKDYNERKSQLIVPRFSLSKNYSLMQVGKLKKQYEWENNLLFDMCVSLRFDWGIQSKIDLNSLDATKVNMSTHGVHEGVGVDVTHGFMNSKLFDEYSCFYNDMDYIFRQHGVSFTDEHLFHFYLDFYKLPYFRNSYLNDYILVRQ